MRETLTVLFIEPPPARRIGGIETALAGWARALTAAGVEVVRTDTAAENELASADVVHFHGLWETAHNRARRWCRRAGKPFAVSPHGMLEDWAFRHRGWKKRPYFHLIERRSLASANALLATSDEEAATLRRWFPADKVNTLPLGGDPVEIASHRDARARLGLPANEFVLLFLSRCHEKKGLHLLVEALPSAARAAQRPIHLVVVGEGDAGYVEPLRAATERWNGAVRASWLGACWGPEKWDYLTAADLLCLPTFSENFGLVVLESLFAGTPVLTTDATPWGSLRASLPVHLTRPTTADLSTALRERVHVGTTSETDRALTRTASIDLFGWAALAPRYAQFYRRLSGRS